ncbi:WD40-repeat-containing domain protein [Cantharellus anzutake]|uniref:WD40-repeat-containing domain protein n=1 Tax=Cantharellus anzutake TaxID=1750568 RepID=UPI0019056084|nr:WD40-repeat-containing domain protein [Cantharellus anzutake]KAF8318614.1 WD40-repeat-containing domain protein [Cantharellus anzutake]
MLHQAVHDHLYACYGIQGARIISSNFSKELRRMFLFREQNIRMSSQNRVPHVGGIITLTTSVRNLLESSLRPNPPENRNPSIIYVPIGNDPGTSFIPVPTLMRKVVISVQDEICSRSESISTFTILIEHSRIPEAVKCVLSAIRNSYWGDDIFCAPGAPQILSSTQGLLTTLHGAPNEHLRACYGVQRARIILRSFSSGILSLVLSPNGRHLISAPLDASRIVNVATGALLGELEEHTGLVRSVAYSSDGLHLAPSSGDPTVRIYDAASLRKSKGHTNNVLCETFSPNRSHLASVSSDHTGHTDWVRFVLYSPNSRQLQMIVPSFPLRFH